MSHYSNMCCLAGLEGCISVLYILTELINMLPGNCSVNTAQHATIDGTVFSMSSAPSTGGTRGLCNPILGKDSVTDFLLSGDVSNNRDRVFRGVYAECL
jgi:hypothetical protein